MHQQPLKPPGHNHPGNINHTFQHIPPFPAPPFGPPPPGAPHQPPFPPPNSKTWAYYGNWDAYRPFVDTNQFSNAAPGVSSGLYNPQGPLNLGNASLQSTFLTEVKTKCKFALAVKFVFSNENYNKTVDLVVGNIYNVTYLENGDIKRCCGKCSDIWRVLGSDNESYYKIKFDCSVDYSTSTVVIKNDQLRDLSVYTGYENTDTTIGNSKHKYGTTCGTIKDAIVTNATVDANGNIIEGDIINGIIDGYTVDGIAYGVNSNGIEINTINGKTIGGQITGGKIIAGIARTGNIDGKPEEDTNIIVHATIKGTIGNAIIMNSMVEGGSTSEGTIISNTIEDGILYNARITGDDMITTGGITAGNITTGGTTTGGTATGGTMVGLIDGKVYTIEDGTTTPKSGKDLVTSGGVVVGGTIIGGVENGGTIIGAIVKGGVVTNGITLNGKTTNGVLIPTPTAPVPITKIVYQNPEYADLNADGQPLHPDKPSVKPFDSDDLIVKIDPEHGRVIDTNFGEALIQDIPRTYEK